jgi:transmembrane sensor
VDRPQLEIVTAWRRGEVVLENTLLQDAAEEMNRYSEIKLVIDDPRVADIRISGIFRTGDSVRFAHAVAESYQLAVDREPRRIVISRTRN